MQIKLKALFFLTLISLQVSCVKVEDKSDSSQGADLGNNSKPSQESQATKRFASLANSAEPNSYFVKLKIPAGTERLLRQRLDTQEVPVELPLNSNLEVYEDKNVVQGVRYRYAFGHGDINQFLPDIQQEIQVPIDYVVEGTIDLSVTRSIGDLSQFRRIFFRNGATILTWGNPVNINADQIFSNHGVIRAYPENHRHGDARDGRIGGYINISTRQLAGDILFNLDGENGGNGIDGLSAQIGEFDFRTFKSKDGGDGGRPGDGGDTATLFLKVLENVPFIYEIRNTPGTSGRPGMGGGGQPSMYLDRFELQTKPGRNGKDHAPGTNGKKTTSCVYIENRLSACH